MTPGFIATAQATQSALEIEPLVAARLLGHSLLAGLLLMGVTTLGNLGTRKATKPVPAAPQPHPPEKEISLRELALSCANVLFLCFAMCAVIILVNNDLARAFALGAAIALVRFRIKLNAKTLGSAMLFGIVTGMAFGVGQVLLAWGIAGAYCVIQLILVGALRLLPEEKKHPEPAKSPVPVSPVLSQPLTAAHGLE